MRKSHQQAGHDTVTQFSSLMHLLLEQMLPWQNFYVLVTFISGHAKQPTDIGAVGRPVGACRFHNDFTSERRHPIFCTGVLRCFLLLTPYYCLSSQCRLVPSQALKRFCKISTTTSTTCSMCVLLLVFEMGAKISTFSVFQAFKAYLFCKFMRRLKTCRCWTISLCSGALLCFDKVCAFLLDFPVSCTRLPIFIVSLC